MLWTMLLPAAALFACGAADAADAAVSAVILPATIGTGMPAAAQDGTPDEAGLRRADAAQHQAARTRDADALAAMMHPAFQVNAPEGEMWSREKTVALWRNRGIGHDRFDRFVETVSLDGPVGVVAGREIVQPSADSIAGRRRADGGRAVERRFTNVWLWKDGRWWFFARHANERVERR